MEEESARPLELLQRFKIPLFLFGLGFLLLLLGVRIFLYYQKNKTEVVFIEASEQEASDSAKLAIYIAGAVVKPGLYELTEGERIQKALDAAGGLAAEADHDWVEKQLNLAQKLTDGMKIYIAKKGEKILPAGLNTAQVAGISANQSSISVNTGSSSELESLPGVGPVTAQKIISGRPYTSLEELVGKKALGKSVFEKIKDKISL